jgi:hypothetical protein
MILGKHKKGAPRKWDLLLAEAEYLVESERCQQCGQLKYICQSDDPDIGFSIRAEECHATQARARSEKQRTNNGKKEAPAGVILGTEPFTYSRTPLVELRIPYYESEAKRLDALEKERPFRPRD